MMSRTIVAWILGVCCLGGVAYANPVTGPGKFGAVSKEIEVKTREMSDVIMATAGNINQKSNLSNRTTKLANEILESLDKVEPEPWAEKERTIPVRNAVAEIMYLAKAIGEEKDADFFRSETASLEVALAILKENVRELNVDVESSVYSSVKSHAQVLEYQNEEVLLSKTHREKIEKFIAERKNPAHTFIVTIFSWSHPGKKAELADKRAANVRKFIEAISFPKEVRLINMDRDISMFQKLFNTKEYQIKEAYKAKTFDDTREKSVGWFLSRAAGPDKVVVLFE